MSVGSHMRERQLVVITIIQARLVKLSDMMIKTEDWHPLGIHQAITIGNHDVDNAPRFYRIQAIGYRLNYTVSMLEDMGRYNKIEAAL